MMSSSLWDLLRVARTVASTVFEGLWLFGFRLAGTLSKKTPRPWASLGGQRVLVVAPHPDDEVICCGGTLIRHRRNGDLLCVVYVSDGSRSRALGLHREQMAVRRRQEAMQAIHALGVHRYEWFGLAEGEWEMADFQARLDRVMIEFCPDILYTPSRIDFHPEHCRVAHGIASILLQCRYPTVVRIYQTQIPLTRLLTNVIADVSDIMDVLQHACKVYETQRGNFPRSFRQRRYAAGFFRAGAFAEEFLELSAEQFCRVHDTDPKAWDTQSLRGIRTFSFSDPLSYLRGRRLRRCLAEEIV